MVNRVFAERLSSLSRNILLCALLLIQPSNDRATQNDSKSGENLTGLRDDNKESERPTEVNMVNNVGSRLKDVIKAQELQGYRAEQLSMAWNLKDYVQSIMHILKTKVCYNRYGCFTKTYPWDSLWNILPQPPSQLKTKFFIHTRQMPKGTRVKPDNLRSIKMTNRKTVFIIHGWKGTYKSSRWIRRMKDLFLRRGSFNVIGVYWGKGAKVNYLQAAGNTRLVGAQVAYLIERLHNEYGLHCSNVHMIGYSLGAQIAGFAGRRLRQNGFRIARITGLDPAGPIFRRKPIIGKLDPTDAKFVDVIHTSFLSGYRRNSGHASFHVNKGFVQPGCGIDLTCSHRRAVTLYMNTIAGPKCYFKAYKCNNYILFHLGLCKNCNKSKLTSMGYDTSHTARGTYYVRTTNKPPYCS